MTTEKSGDVSEAHRKSKYTTTEDGSTKVLVPKWFAKILGYGKIASVAFGILSALWLFFVAVYAVPTQLKAHEATIEAQAEALNSNRNKIDELIIFKSTGIQTMEEIKDTLKTLVQAQERRDGQMDKINTSLTRNVTALSYLEKSINELKGDIKELKRKEYTNTFGLTIK